MSNICDDKARVLASVLLDNKTLEKLGDSGARGIAKLLCSSSTKLKSLNLANNKISHQDHGGALLMAGLAKGVTTSKLKSLDVSSNGLGAECVTVLCTLLKRNGKALTTLDLSCNKLGNFGTLPGGAGQPVLALRRVVAMEA
ncbi:hypothetical protein BC829DRAFT_443666 [Chytridium lagenaria]|nr:hypothetical protein BC829DRAFT_443666 [Chytridium lagenaria]